MSDAVIVAAYVVAVAAACRSTWSPCGLSMLSTITPMGEKGRGASFQQTAWWFIIGAFGGGACLGAVLAVAAWAESGLHAESRMVGIMGMAAAVVAASSDARIGGFGLPVHRRQVNERWLDRFRPWVYGAGFGWQIGCGLATYIVTSAVYLAMVLATLGGQPLLAFGVGLLFGTLRGLAVLLGRSITSSQALMEFHRRFSALGNRVRWMVVGVEVVVAVVLGCILNPWIGFISGSATVVVAAIVAVQRQGWPARPDHSSVTDQRSPDEGSLVPVPTVAEPNFEDPYHLHSGH